MVTNLNWAKFGKRGDDTVEFDNDGNDNGVSQVLCEGHIYKLHGDMDHNERKKNFFGFDKADRSVLICTDVASRGLDFKHVEWIIQYDLSS